MNEQINKQIEEEALRRFPPRKLKMGDFGDDMNDEGRINFKEGAKWLYNNNFYKADSLVDSQKALEYFIDKYIEKTGYGMDMWSKEENAVVKTVSEIIEESKKTVLWEILPNASVDAVKKIDSLRPDVENIIYRSLQDLLTDSNIERSDMAAKEVIDYLKFRVSDSNQENNYNNKTDEAINFVQQAYVSDSKGYPSLLMGDVAKLINLITGETIGWNRLLINPPKDK